MSIKIEDRLFDDQRYLNLIARLGDAPKALGSLGLAWKLAAKHWKRKSKLIPADEWEKLPNSEDIWAVGLAEFRDGGVYLRGSEEVFGLKRAQKVSTPSKESLSLSVWQAYLQAYINRYGTEPVKNGKVMGQIAQFVKRLGSESEQVAAFYVRHNDAFYVRSMHAIGPLLRDAEKLRTEWFTGQKMLGSKAREVERMQHNSDAFDRAAERLGYFDEDQK